MPSISSNLLLEVWENNWNRTPCEQAVALVTSGFPELTYQQVLQLPIGRRDTLLMSLRSSLFGGEIALVSKCPRCDVQNELSFDLRQPESESLSMVEISLEAFGLEQKVRLPTSEDLLEVQRRSPDDPRQFIVERCLLGPIEPNVLAPAMLDEISRLMSSYDPYADIQLNGTCVSCMHEWDILFDIVAVLWSEICVWAQRLMSEIHILANNYGWSESQILSLSPIRRQIYLNMSGQ